MPEQTNEAVDASSAFGWEDLTCTNEKLYFAGQLSGMALGQHPRANNCQGKGKRTVMMKQMRLGCIMHGP